MTHGELREIGRALFGECWGSPLARALGMSPRHMRRLTAGTAPISAKIEGEVCRIARVRRRGIADALNAASFTDR